MHILKLAHVPFRCVIESKIAADMSPLVTDAIAHVALQEAALTKNILATSAILNSGRM